MHCTLPAQALALGQAGHHLEGVAEDHAVRPVLVVLVELGLVDAVRDAVEVGEEIGCELPALVLASREVRRRSSISTFGWTFSWM